MSKTLDTKTETEVVALIARGDSYQSIIDMLHERDIDITKGTITNIKKRNQGALDYMQAVMVEHETSHATSILNKSRELLERKLDDQAKLADELAELRTKYLNHELDYSEYFSKVDAIHKRELTATELNSITKESFNQSQVEKGKPSSITENPSQARENMMKILAAIKNGDEKAAIDALFLHD